MSAEHGSPAPFRTFFTTVASVEDAGPHLRRVAFGGGDLPTFAPVGPDTFVYLLVAPPGCDHLTIAADFSWEQYYEMPVETRPVGAYYTVRRWEPERERLEILMVLHGDEGSGSAWAQRARVGEPAALWGPRTTYAPPEGTDRLLLVADDTGLPATAGILEQLPRGWTATVVAEVDGVADRQLLPEGHGIEVHWVHRDGAPPGTTTLLPDAVRRLPPPGPTTYVWGGAESRALSAVRAYVRREVGLAREAVSLVAYWRHAESPLEPAEATED